MARQVKLQSDKTFLLFGCGYVASALVDELKQHGFQIFATARTAQKAQECRALGISPIAFNGTATRQLKSVLRGATHVLSSIPPASIPPGENGDPIIEALGKNWDKIAPNLKWAGYLSATSVYGNRNGHWVFEDELLRPTNARGKQRVLAELAWYESGAPVHIFRLAGIYGPERNAFKRVQSTHARAIIKPGHVSSRIHVDDIVSALLLSMDKPNPLRIYNLADDMPSPPQDVLNYAAKLLDIALPQIPFEDADMSPLARSFYTDLRRTSNAHIKSELNWSPKYAHYKQGLKALLKTQDR
ncbi:MAG: NAD(P)-dependent oxidoreductase [Robiginitomaculum sp.]|nr:MAG: NAD(P)-dependent oxidoreductase [Robiginitomaculum sp.]